MRTKLSSHFFLLLFLLFMDRRIISQFVPFYGNIWYFSTVFSSIYFLPPCVSPPSLKQARESCQTTMLVTQIMILNHAPTTTFKQTCLHFIHSQASHHYLPSPQTPITTKKSYPPPTTTASPLLKATPLIYPH